MRVCTFIVIAGCTSSSPPLRNVHDDSQAHLSDAFERAVLELNADRRVDYARPFVNRPRGRSQTIAVLHESCTTRNLHACILEAETGRDDKRAYDGLAARCRAGEIMSCRALPLDDQSSLFAAYPGAVSRSTPCHGVTSQKCDLVALRSECRNGFPGACFELANRHPDNEATLMARARDLSAAGCRLDIAEECAVLAYGTVEIALHEHICTMFDRCETLSQLYGSDNDVKRARDSMERECQYRGDKGLGACAEVGWQYKMGAWEEPVVGRGRQLLEYVCARTDLHFPQCDP